MKVATKVTPVYSRDGSLLIGELARGEKALALGTIDSGMVLAYVIGLVKPENAGQLVDEEQWENEISEADRFLAWIGAQVGCLYVWGAQGQQMTPALIKKRENSARNYNRALKLYNAHAAAGLPLTAYDCSGLVVKYLMDRGLLGCDTTASGLYFSQCRDIKQSELCAADLVFKKSRTSGKVHHVGVYMGDGTVVHAKGRDDGVVREDFGKAGWNLYGRLIKLGQAEAPAFTRVLKRTKPMMRGDDIREAQSRLTAKGFETYGIDGIFGPKTQKAAGDFQTANGLEATGAVDAATWNTLMGG